MKEAVLALVAVEKVYRMIPDPNAGAARTGSSWTPRWTAFLKQNFVQYARYFSHPVEGQQVPGSVTFTHAREDEQYDDLTLLVIRRK